MSLALWILGAPALAAPEATRSIDLPLDPPSPRTATKGRVAMDASALTLYAIVPGYGLAHFLAGDEEAGKQFLALDLGATAVWMAGPALVALLENNPMATTPSPTANAVFLIGLLAQGGLKVWEVTSARELADK
jgi:hypothetical protein